MSISAKQLSTYPFPYLTIIKRWQVRVIVELGEGQVRSCADANIDASSEGLKMGA